MKLPRELAVRLRELGARLVASWVQRRGENNDVTEWRLYLTEAKKMYLVSLEGEDGWNVWKPVFDGNSVEETLAAMV